MKLRVLLARHGETDWNIGRRYQGQQDTPLNDAGRRQVQALVQRLASESIDAIYASDLKRTMQTASPIAAAHGLAVHPEPRLREMGFGVFEGLTRAEMRARYPDAYHDWYESERNIPPPGGETLSQLHARITAFLNDLVKTHPEDTVLLVGHGGSLRQFICAALGLPDTQRWRMAFGNTSLSEVHIDGKGGRLYRLNDMHHLDGHV